MSYTYNSSAPNSSSGANTITISPPAGALVIVFNRSSGGAGATVTFSDNSSSTWAAPKNNVLSGSFRYSVGYCLSAASGVTTITATFVGGTPGTCDLVAIAYTGMSSPTFVAVTATNIQAAPGTGTDAVTASALACGSTNALFVGFSIDTNGDHGFLGAGTGFTQRYNNDPFVDPMILEDPAAEVTGSNTATFTAGASGGADTYASIAIAFADNTGGGGGNPLFYNRKNVLYFIN